MTDKMTITEALKHARRELEAYKLKVVDRPFYQREVDYLELVVEALEKQIPKKPNTYSDYMRCGRVVNTCPICCKRFDEYVEFCDDCGQAIDWESDEK